jgi:HK97 family phage portal protein
MGLIDRFLGINTTNNDYKPEKYVPNTDGRAALTPPSRSNTIVVNEKTALSLVPVSRSISVLETAAMQIPVEVFRADEKISAPMWLETPDIENNVSQPEFIGTTIVHMALFGNAFWKVTRGARGISNVKVLHPNTVSIIVDDYGNKMYSINGMSIPATDMVHIKLWSKPGVYEYLGEGPIQRHAQIITAALDLQHYADNWFRVAGIPTGILSTTEFLSEDVAKANKKAFVESQQERSVAVLSSGLGYETISLNPEEAQFLENQKFIARQISNMFGVPSIYLGLSIEGQGMTYTNGNEDRNKLYEDGLQQYIVRIEQALTDLLPRGQKAKFNLTEFLRPNQLIRFQAYGLALDKRFMTVDEVRELEGMQPLPADVLAQPNPQPSMNPNATN